MENYKPFISEGVVSLVGDENSSQKVKILRDTGATQSLMLDSVLPLTENSFTGANVLISGVEMGVLEVPLHEVNIDGKFEERNKEKADKALMRNESRNVKENIPEKQESESKSVISRQNLIEEQSNDKENKIALTPVEAEKVSVGYLIKDNILMRKWSPTECDNSKKGETVYQIVVPTVHRQEVLELANDLPVSGHLGVRKTYNRVLQHFFGLV